MFSTQPHCRLCKIIFLFDILPFSEKKIPQWDIQVSCNHFQFCKIPDPSSDDVIINYKTFPLFILKESLLRILFYHPVKLPGIMNLKPSHFHVHKHIGNRVCFRKKIQNLLAGPEKPFFRSILHQYFFQEVHFAFLARETVPFLTASLISNRKHHRHTRKQSFALFLQEGYLFFLVYLVIP